MTAVEIIEAIGKSPFMALFGTLAGVYIGFLLSRSEREDQRRYALFREEQARKLGVLSELKALLMELPGEYARLISAEVHVQKLQAAGNATDPVALRLAAEMRYADDLALAAIETRIRQSGERFGTVSEIEDCPATSLTGVVHHFLVNLRSENETSFAPGSLTTLRLILTVIQEDIEDSLRNTKVSKVPAHFPASRSFESATTVEWLDALLPVLERRELISTEPPTPPSHLAGQ